ncbi:MAG: ABC transporter permease, partial [Cohnella sp.]|nr:ABC transporter permease [Cohnella sp.]
MKIGKLAWANIRKSKSATASLMLLIFIATMLLSTGISVISRMSTFYDDKIEQLGDPHISIIAKQGHDKPDYATFFKNNADVTAVETLPVLYVSGMKFRFGDTDLTNGAVFLNAGHDGAMSPPELVEKLADVGQEDIFVSYGFKSSGGYALGDTLTIAYRNQSIPFRIGGFFETTMMGTSNIGAVKFWLPEASYMALADRLEDSAK